MNADRLGGGMRWRQMQMTWYIFTSASCICMILSFLICPGQSYQSFKDPTAPMIAGRLHMACMHVFKRHVRFQCFALICDSHFRVALMSDQWTPGNAHISFKHWPAAYIASLPRYAPLADTAKDVPHTAISTGSSGPAWSPPKRRMKTPRCTKEVRASPALRI